jgi:hypothetical protein
MTLAIFRFNPGHISQAPRPQVEDIYLTGNTPCHEILLADEGSLVPFIDVLKTQ